MPRGSSRLAAGTFLLLGLAAAVSPPVATVGKEEIPRSAFEELMEDLAGERVLLRLIDEQLILQAGQAAGVLVSEEEAAAELERVAAAFHDPAAFSAALSAADLDRVVLARRIRADLTLENLALQTFNPPEEELVNHYARHREAFGRPTVIRARHLAVPTEAEALALREQLDRGADFATLARTHSVDAATRDRGGDMGTFAKTRPYARGMVSLTGELFPINWDGHNVMGPTTDRLQLWQYAEVARGTGGLTGPVKTVFGWSLVKLEEYAEGTAPPYPEVRPLVRSHLFRMRYPLRLEILRWELRQRAAIQGLPRRYKHLEKPAGELKWTIDPALVDPPHPSLLNLRVYGLQDVLRLYLLGDLMQDFDALRLTTKNYAYASRMAVAGSMRLRMDRAVDAVELRKVGGDNWSRITAQAKARYREGGATWLATQEITADVVSTPDGYRWKVVEATPPIRETVGGAAR